MYKNRKGFSLAEILIALLVISIVGAATLPTITKRNAKPDKLWDWAGLPIGSASFVGTHVLLDSRENHVQIPPQADKPEEFHNYYFNNLIRHPDQAIGQTAFLPSYDKMILINNYREQNATQNINPFQVPHINFYNKNSKYIEYAGRLVSDPYNLAFGVGSLQNLAPNYQNISNREGLFNTAIGHYALFSNEIGSYNTALGRMALASFRAADSNPETHNVAIGNESQMYNVSGTLNTAVGYRSLTGTTTGSNNIALGAENLPTSISASGEMIYPFGNNNISIGSRKNTTENANNNLFIGNNNSHTPLIQADMENNRVFNLNTDELIVNTVDGKHTILKIYMQKDAAGNFVSVDLPQPPKAQYISPGENQPIYDSLGYCTGEGTEDVYRLSKNSKDARALADICIANFRNNIYVVPPYSTSERNGIAIELDNLMKGEPLNLVKTLSEPDWDLFIAGYDYAYDLGNSTGFNNKLTGDKVPRIQTVKAALNYLDTFKEGEGIISTALDTFFQNVKCHFTYLIGSSQCGAATVGTHDTLWGDIKAQIKHHIETAKQWMRNNISDIRLKNVYGKSTIGLKEINALKIKNYTFKADKKQTPHVGVIAQELQKVFPNSVIEGADGYLRIKQEEMFYAMVNAIQELDKKDKQLVEKFENKSKSKQKTA